MRIDAMSVNLLLREAIFMVFWQKNNFKIQQFINCNTTYVVYCITCTCSDLLYIGCTKRKLKTRIAEDISLIYNNSVPQSLELLDISSNAIMPLLNIFHCMYVCRHTCMQTKKDWKPATYCSLQRTEADRSISAVDQWRKMQWTSAWKC